MSGRSRSRSHSRAHSRTRHREDRSRHDRHRHDRYDDDPRDRYRDDSRDRHRGGRDKRAGDSRRYRSPDRARDLFSADDHRSKQDERLSRPSSSYKDYSDDRKRRRDRSSSRGDSRRERRRSGGRTPRDGRRHVDRSPSPKRSRRGSSADSRASKTASLAGRHERSRPSSPRNNTQARRDETNGRSRDDRDRPHRDPQERNSRQDADASPRDHRALAEAEERLIANRPKRREAELEEVDPWEDPAEAKRKKQLARQAKLAEWKAKRLQEMAAKSAGPSAANGSIPDSPRAAATAQPSPTAISSSLDHMDVDSATKTSATTLDPKAIARRAEEASQRLKAQLDASTGAKSKSAESTLPHGNHMTDLNGKTSAHLSLGTSHSRPLPASAANNMDTDLDMLSDDRPVESSRPSKPSALRRPMLANGTDKTAAPVSSLSAADDVDPLDAFMSDLGSSSTAHTTTTASAPKARGIIRELVSGEDGAESMDAVGDEDEWPTATKKKKKELAVVDHAKIKYEPFRKSFYTEPQELQDMDDEEVKSLRFELDDIQVKGANVPKPVRKFAQFGLGSQVLDIVRKLGFEKPTSIQSQAMPAIMSGRDVIGIAKTGSGKTIAFLLPMFRHIKDQRPIENLEGPISLIVAPTRELATQIHKECQPYLKALNLRAVCAYGGSELAGNIAALKRGAEIVVCTPGRMIDLMTANNGRVLSLKRVTYVVLDEADRMYDMGFEPQVSRVLSSVRPDRQMVLFSATFSKQMETLARKSLVKPVQINVGGTNTVAAEITQQIEVRAESTKFNRTLMLLGELLSTNEDARALIFVERQGSADVLLGKLAKSGYPCVSVHGGVEQADRDQYVTDFKSGACPVMIATSVAARGLDVKQLKLVINYDVPNHLEDYVHRAGRTGRAGETGTAVTFITKDQGRFAGDLVKALKLSNQEVPKPLDDLANDHIRKVKSGEATAAGRGFGGKGLETFESQRDAERRQEKRAAGLGEDDDDDDDAGDGSIDPKIQVKARDDTSSAPTPTTAQPGTPTVADSTSELKFDFVIQRTEKPAAAAKGADSKAARLAAAAAAINSRVGARGTGRPVDNKGPDAGEFHAVLEINDFPQKCRWAVTNRSNVAKVLEMTQASITTKGQYYKPGDEPPVDGPPKMYVLIEGDTERQVDMATRELVRLMKTAAAQEAEASSRMASTSGRYSVL